MRQICLRVCDCVCVRTNDPLSGGCGKDGETRAQRQYVRFPRSSFLMHITQTHTCNHVPDVVAAADVRLPDACNADRFQIELCALFVSSHTSDA